MKVSCCLVLLLLAACALASGAASGGCCTSRPSRARGGLCGRLLLVRRAPALDPRPWFGLEQPLFVTLESPPTALPCRPRVGRMGPRQVLRCLRCCRPLCAPPRSRLPPPAMSAAAQSRRRSSRPCWLPPTGNNYAARKLTSGQTLRLQWNASTPASPHSVWLIPSAYCPKQPWMEGEGLRQLVAPAPAGEWTFTCNTTTAGDVSLVLRACPEGCLPCDASYDDAAPPALPACPAVKPQRPPLPACSLCSSPPQFFPPAEVVRLQRGQPLHNRPHEDPGAGAQGAACAGQGTRQHMQDREPPSAAVRGQCAHESPSSLQPPPPSLPT